MRMLVPFCCLLATGGGVVLALNPARPAMIDGANVAIMSCLEFYEGSALSKTIRVARGAKGR